MSDTTDSEVEIYDATPTAAPEPPPAKPSINISEAQRDAFFKSFLADRPYEEEFSRLNGNFVFRVKALTMKENADLIQQLAMDRQRGLTDNDGYFMKIPNYRLALGLVSINGVAFGDGITPDKVPLDTKAGTSYVSARAALFDNWSMPKMAAVQSAFVEFDQRVLQLVEEINNPDFWKAAAQSC